MKKSVIESDPILLMPKKLQETLVDPEILGSNQIQYEMGLSYANRSFAEVMYINDDLKRSMNCIGTNPGEESLPTKLSLARKLVREKGVSILQFYTIGDRDTHGTSKRRAQSI